MTLHYRPRPGETLGKLADYLSRGAFEMASPHPLLDPVFYGEQRADVAAALAGGMPILTHYRAFGAREGLNPHPLFDSAFYVAQCPESLQPDTDPVTHFMSVGWRQGFDPHPLFSTTYYLARSPDVAEAGLNPLTHFLGSGLRENRATSPYFDAAAYLRRYPDVGSSGLAPLMHYLLVGMKARYSAGPWADHLQAKPGFGGPFGLLDYLRGETESYYAWVRTSRALPDELRRKWAETIEGFRTRPMVAVLMHLTKAGAVGLSASLDSLRSQLYADWMLCVAVDPDVPETASALLMAGDKRVRVLHRGTSAEPGFALNTALDAAPGAFVSVLAPGDRLHVLALACLVQRLQATNGAAVIYGDEDVVSARGFHEQPSFKPDWSPDLMLGQDYLCRPALLSTDLARRAGGYRPGLTGAAEHDLFLRLMPELLRNPPLHVRHPLYHRASQAAETSRARQDGLYRAVKAHVQTSGFDSIITRGGAAGTLRVAFEPRGEPLVSVVIPTANAVFAGPLGREAVIDNCIASLRGKTSWAALEIIVVHDGNLSPEQVRRFTKDGVKLVAYDRPMFNFSRKINLGVAASTGEYVLILNDDVVAKRSDWLHRMMGWAQQDGVGMVGPKLFFPDGRLQHTGVIVQHGNPGHLYYRADGYDAGYAEMNDVPRNWLVVTGACQLVRRDVYDAVGGYDEDLPLNFNDVDICLRIVEHGLRVVYEPHAELFHFEGISKLIEIGNQLTTPYETDHFQARWRARYPEDPFYHPDLPPYAPLGIKRPEEVRGTPGQARKLPAAKVAASWTKGVNWLGPMNRSSGMGTASRSYLTSFQAVDLQTRLVPLDKIFGHQAKVEHGLTSTMQDFPITFVQANADTTKIVFEHYGDEIGRAKYRIGLWVWELPTAHPEWFEHAQRYDEIWVPSSFNQVTFQAIMRKPVMVLPYALADLPVLGEAEKKATRAELGLPQDAFVFLYMFDTYSFVDRKNPLALLDAFEAEFAGRKDVVLLLKISYMANLASSYSVSNLAVQLRLEQIQARCPNVHIFSEVLPREKVYEVINAADCYVSPHRSEGFGLTVAEAMHYGKAVIATDFSGTTDFVQHETGLPLRYKLVEIEQTMGPYRKGDIWADPSVEHLAELMRTVVGDAELCQRLGAAASAHMARHYAPSVVGQVARRRIRSIAAELA